MVALLFCSTGAVYTNIFFCNSLVIAAVKNYSVTKVAPPKTRTPDEGGRDNRVCFIPTEFSRTTIRLVKQPAQPLKRESEE